MQTRDANIRELMDAEMPDSDSLRRSLADIRRINALLGWTAFTTRAVARQVRASGNNSFSLLDVATGSADIPLAVARWAQRSGIQARIVASDLQAEMVAVAREQAVGMPDVTVERQDALALPYEAGSFDIALCTLALHHFAPDEAVALLRNLARVGRHVLVFDLVRSRVAYAGAVLLTTLTRMDPMTRHDGPASVRRAYTAPELRALAAQAGLRDARVRVAIPFRLVLSAPATVPLV